MTALASCALRSLPGGFLMSVNGTPTGTGALVGVGVVGVGVNGVGVKLTGDFVGGRTDIALKNASKK